MARDACGDFFRGPWRRAEQNDRRIAGLYSRQAETYRQGYGLHHYNEALETEKRALAALVERSFYPGIAESQPHAQAASIMEMLKVNPELAGQILKNLLLNAEYAQPSSSFAD